jgi:hypothetical protein
MHISFGGSHLHDWELTAFNEGRLTIACPQISVRQNITTDGLFFIGPGYIRQDSARRIVFEFIATEKSHGADEVLDIVYNANDVSPGQMIPRSHYYDFSAKDLFGREWNNHGVSIDFDGGSGGLSITGALRSIDSSEASDYKKSHLYMILETDAEIPANTGTEERITTGSQKKMRARRNASEFEACGCNFLLTKDNSTLHVDLKSEYPSLPDHIDTRVIEALQFVSGKQLRRQVIFKSFAGRRTTSIWSADDKQQTCLNPPICYRGQLPDDDVWKLFETYLRFIWHYNEERLHPITDWIDAVRGASEVPVSLFARGLALGVAIEGVAKVLSDTSNDAEFDKEKICQAICHIENWTGDNDLKVRIINFIRSLTARNARNPFIRLHREGVVTKSDLEAWKKLRNMAAHAEPPRDTNFQEWLDLCYAAEVTLYHLVFAAIGYSGPFTDYSVKGWPKGHFKLNPDLTALPLPLESSPSQAVPGGSDGGVGGVGDDGDLAEAVGQDEADAAGSDFFVGAHEVDELVGGGEVGGAGGEADGLKQISQTGEQ